MSIGNLKTEGNKGNNFPWQIKVLQGLDKLLSTISGTGTYLTPKARITNILRTTSNGTIAAGKYSVSFANVGSDDSVVKGVIIKSGETINFDAGTLNNTLDAIAYDATGTDLLIIYIS